MDGGNEKGARMTRTHGVRGVLLVLLVSLCSVGAVCELPESPRPSNKPGAIHITARTLQGVPASAVQIRLDRWSSCATLMQYFCSQLMETRTVSSNASGEVPAQSAAPGRWTLTVLDTDLWSHFSGGGDVQVSAGHTVDISVTVQPHP